MSELAYARPAIAADLLRSGAGTVLTGTPLLLGGPPAWLAVVLAVLLALFLSHLAATVSRSRQRYRLGEKSLHVFPARITIEWDDLDELHLDYFSTRRDGRAGWMQLRLRAARSSVRVDSGLNGFRSVLARAVRAARERGLSLSPTTAANLAWLEEQSGGVPC